MFQSPYGDYLVRNNAELGIKDPAKKLFQSPYGDYLVRNYEINEGEITIELRFSPLTGIT